MRALVYMGILLIMRLSSKFTFDYKYILNGFRHHNESRMHMLVRDTVVFSRLNAVEAVKDPTSPTPDKPRSFFSTEAADDHHSMKSNIILKHTCVRDR